MNSIRNAVLILVFCGLGCAKPQRAKPAAATNSSDVSVAQSMPPATRFNIDSFFRMRGETLDTVLASQGNYTVAVGNQADSFKLVTIVHDSQGVHQADSAINVSGISEPNVQLIDLGQGTALRVITFDDLVENAVGTSVDHISPVGVSFEFADTGAVCKPSAFTTHNGTYSLHSYADSPFASDCLSPCAEALRAVMGTEPAQVIDLDRIDGSWKRVTKDADSTVARGYVKAVDALRRGGIPECASDSERLLKDIARWRRSM